MSDSREKIYQKLRHFVFDPVAWKQIEGVYELRLPIVSADGKEQYSKPQRYTLGDVDVERCAMVAQAIYDQFIEGVMNENDIESNSTED